MNTFCWASCICGSLICDLYRAKTCLPRWTLQLWAPSCFLAVLQWYYWRVALVGPIHRSWRYTDCSLFRQHTHGIGVCPLRICNLQTLRELSWHSEFFFTGVLCTCLKVNSSPSKVRNTVMLDTRGLSGKVWQCVSLSALVVLVGVVYIIITKKSFASSSSCDVRPPLPCRPCRSPVVENLPNYCIGSCSRKFATQLQCPEKSPASNHWVITSRSSSEKRL